VTLPHACQAMEAILEAAESALAYDPALREYSIAYLSDSSVQLIEYCPFCGAKLPESLRDEWFERLAALGFDDPWIQDIPDEFRDDRWWRAAEL
jgi:hypothetical protein